MAPVAQLAQLRLFDELGRAKQQKLLGPTPEDRGYHLNGPVEIGELLLSASTAESNHACCCAEIASQHSRSSGVFRQLMRRRNVRRWHSRGLQSPRQGGLLTEAVLNMRALCPTAARAE